MAGTEPAGSGLSASWRRAVGSELEQPYMAELREFLRQEKRARKRIYPPSNEIFNALNTTPVEAVKAVVLGQDPYHGAGQAHGLCFSVKPGIEPPPSLVNILREIESDLGLPPPGHGCLTAWARRGVLLLNAVLTVEHGKAGAHQGKGWERFTDAVVAHLDRERDGLVFLLWGGYAQQKGRLIDRRRQCVLEAPHPSPLSANRGFFGCRHFSRCNDYLASRGQLPIDWSLPKDPLSPR